ncbi:MAG: metal ABC transporter permease [Candidatus Izemoplasmataceae bacterium]
MIGELLEAFSYGFMIRAFVVGVSIALSASLIGSFLVLKKFSMIGHGLSHVAFATVAIALTLGSAPTLFTLPIVSLAAILVLKMNEKASMHGDSAIGLIATMGLALGTVLASLNGGFNVDLYSYLFGSILTIQSIDVYLSVGVSLVIITLVLVFYQELFALVYDEEFARINGIKTKRFNVMLAILTAVTITIGIRAIGTMLISSLIIFPMVSVMQLRLSFKKTVIYSAILSVVNVLFGLSISYLYNLPSGSTIVLFSGFVFLVIYLGVRMRNLGGFRSEKV